MPSSARSWTAPKDALAKIGERIECDLGTEDDAAGARPANFTTYATGAGLADGTRETGEAAYRSNYLFIERRNHWQGGSLWPIAYPTPDIAARQLRKVRPMFTSVDTVNRATERLVDALMGREATIDIVPLAPIAPASEHAGEDEVRRVAAEEEAQAAEIAAARASFSAWWDSVHLWDRAKDACRRATWACRGPLRVRLLPKALAKNERTDATELVGGLAFPAALRNVTLSAPLPNAALVYVDPDTEEAACIIGFTGENGVRCAEVWFEEGGVVFRRILRDGLDAEELKLPGGALPLYEVTGSLLLTPSVRQGQAQLNYTKTKLGRVVQTACDRQMFATDIEEPGEWSAAPPPPGVPVRETVDIDGNPLYFHPGSLDVGPELLVLANGRVVPNGEAGETALTPQIVVVDPVDPKYITDAIEAEEAALLRGMSQGHTVTLSKATSGDEKKQDRADFEKKVQSYKVSTELAIAGVLTAAGKNALLMTAENDPMQDFFNRYYISVTLHIDTGPQSAEEIRQDVELADKGYKPRAEVLASAGRIDDVDAAEAAIRADPVQRTRRLKEVLEVATTIKSEWREQAAVEYLRMEGVDERLVAVLARSDFTNGEQ
jgi:hypothetical protein